MTRRMNRPTLTIARRFCGPSESANGGYTCGRISEHVEAPAEVTLRAPPPLDTALTFVDSERGISLHHGDQRIATARTADPGFEPPPFVNVERARRASANYTWANPLDHPFPQCFVCGPSRKPGDGLCIFPGAVDMDRQRLAAATWTPDASLCRTGASSTNAEHVWAALDCPSWFGAEAHGVDASKVLLGRMVARVTRCPEIGEECVVVGAFEATEGRKIFARSALYTSEAELLGIARATWISV